MATRQYYTLMCTLKLSVFLAVISETPLSCRKHVFDNVCLIWCVCVCVCVCV